MNPTGVLPARRLGIVRSLGRRGIPVWILDDELSIGRFSRYAMGATRSHLLGDEQATNEGHRHADIG
jgi:D-aspartate ligase